MKIKLAIRESHSFGGYRVNLQDVSSKDYDKLILIFTSFGFSRNRNIETELRGKSLKGFWSLLKQEKISLIQRYFKFCKQYFWQLYLSPKNVIYGFDDSKIHVTYVKKDKFLVLNFSESKFTGEELLSLLWSN